MGSSHNKRIAKNTMMLYVRMAFTMFVTFFTTRIVIRGLGEEYFGLANVVGGIATMFSFFSGMLSGSTSRFITVELGCGDSVSLKRMVNLIQLIFLGGGGIIFLLLESIGVWILLNYVDIPVAKQHDCMIFFQFSILTFVIGFITIPFSTLVIAHEDMNYYAWISIGDVTVKLGLIFAVFKLGVNHFIGYSAVLALVAFMDGILYMILCFFRYAESHFAFYWNYRKTVEFISYCCWSIWGALIPLFNNVFVNILLNNGFGAVVSGARGVAQQVLGGVSGFCQNYVIAANPPIIKLFAGDEHEKAYDLVERSARLGYFLLMLAAIPIIFEINFILKIWLSIVPVFTGVFVRLVLVQTLIDAITYPVATLVTARGKIALYQATIGGMSLLLFPVSWIWIKFGGAPTSVYIVGIAISFACMWGRLFFCNRLCGLRIKEFIRKVMLPVIATSGMALVVPIFTYMLMSPGWGRFVAVIMGGGGGGMVAVWLGGLRSEERKQIRKMLMDFLKKDNLYVCWKKKQ